MNTLIPSELIYDPSKLIYDALWEIKDRILIDLDLNPSEHSIGGMHFSKDYFWVELDIYDKGGRYVTDACLQVSDTLEDVK